MSTPDAQIVEALRASVKETERLKQAYRRLQAASREPIAIVGIGCRYPGGVETADDLWDLVAEGRDAITGFPTDRGWDIEGIYDPDPDHPGTTYSRHGGFLHDAADFDAELFGIGPREALAMDPQQRLLLETAWQAFEHAGIDPGSARGSDTGVFTGVMYADYITGTAPPEVEGYSSVGMAGSVISGRLSYSFGFEGPAVTLDTACSSSLVALHLACQALRRGECSKALAGGVTVMATPIAFTEFSRQRGLAPDGRCRSFAAAADGTGWGEGSGLLLLERLSDARRNGHEVLAVIRGSAVNQDGTSNGLTAPHGPSQERVIRQALADAGIGASEVDAVEAHGTATSLGDPIEARALLATYGRERDGRPLRLGSIKSNIGHTQAAAGVAGIVKMVMAMRHGVLPRTLHVDEPTPHVDWSAGEVELLTEEEPWTAGERPRRAGVSSFGISGTNAHLILEEAPQVEQPAGGEQPSHTLEALPWVVSGKSEAALREQARRLVVRLTANPDADPLDVGYSLASGRANLDWRAVVVGADREELLAGLEALAAGNGAGAGSVARGTTAFLFTGQGAQRAGMGAGLHGAFPVFAEAFDAACAALDPHLDRPLKELAFAAAGSEQAALLDRTEFTQASLFALEVALFSLVESLGTRPDFLIGHSVGELSAAHVAGVLSLADAAKLVAARGRLMGALPEGGAMVALQASEEEVVETLAGFEQAVSIAGVNGPMATVVSGDEEPVSGLERLWRERDRKTTRLRVSHAFHSHRMDPMLAEFGALAATLEFQAPQIPVVSNLTGEIATAEQLASPEYWVEHVRRPVRFLNGIRTLEAQGVVRHLELGPDAVLTAMAAGCLEQDAALAPALRRDRPEAQTLLAGLGAIHAAGASVDWTRLFEGTGARRVELPTYPFQRKRYWIAGHGGGADVRAAGLAPTDHPLLGAAVSVAGEDEWLLSGRVSLETDTWLGDHAVFDTVLFPGAGIVELVLRAGVEAGCAAVEDLTLEAPLVLPEKGAVQLQVTVGAADESGRRGVSVHSRPEPAADDDAADWTRNASGLIAPAEATEVTPLDADWPPAEAEEVDVEALYDAAAAAGFAYGPAFQGLRSAWRRGDEVFAEIDLPEEQRERASRFAIHPALLDASLHTAFARAGGGTGGLPFAWSGVRLASPGASALRVRATVSEQGFALAATDESGAAVLSVDSLATRPVDPTRLAAASAARSDGLFGVDWVEAAAGEGAFGGECELLELSADPATTPEAVRDLVAGLLATLQERLADEDAGRLAVVTRAAAAAREGESPELAAAAAWGLVRSAQSEHPERLVLVDLDGSEASRAALPGALASGELQIALRDGVALVPRLVRVAPEDGTAAPGLDPSGTVLITGGTGGLGAIVARHLAAEQGATSLLLTSRRGLAAPGAEELVAELAKLGCEARVEACDASDRRQLAGLLASVPADRPLTAVYHSAGVLDDGLLNGLDRERLDRVLAPKVDAAWHLHELTAELDLDRFVLFSSAAAIFGNPGQANYAAANSFLDALAARRRAAGLAAQSLAWGMWEEAGGMADRIADRDRARLGRFTVPITEEEGVELLDRAAAVGRPLLVPVGLDLAELRPLARSGALPPLLSRLVKVPARRARDGAGSLARRLAGAAEGEREELVLDLVLGEVATVLGKDSGSAIEPEAAFKDLGFDSLAAVELRNRLTRATDMRLPSTLVFDHPSPAAVAGFLLSRVDRAGRPAASPARPAAAADEPIAIVGMACRYPGGVSSPEDLWRLVAEGRDGISSFPDDRGWDLERLYHPDPAHPGTTYTQKGGFLHEAGEFDAGFFGIGPREALAMDPQQRLLLETAWEALERAGIDPVSLRGSDTGTFAGLMTQDYGVMSAGAMPPELEGYLGTGLSGSVLSGRIAYTFGLEGPAVTLDTACSSSLVALHLACQALRAGESSLALAGGVTVMSTPINFTEFSRQRGLAADGRCRAYADGADGTTWGEGSGLLVLERLSDAQRNGREILAVVRGSAVNQDGASNGLTAPNGPSQERVIRQALANAGVAPAEVEAIEGHGTGTPLGDPIEAQALLDVYGGDRERPLRLGSVKSNLGHTQAAAGVAGVIKMVEALRHEVLPQTLHVDRPSSHVDWSEGAIELLTEAAEWRRGERPRRAGVSAFGISGTNAHVVLEEAPAPEAEAGEDPVAQPAGPVAWPLSAKAPGALREQAGRLAARVESRPELSPRDIGFTLAGRAALEERAVVVGADRDELLAGLDAVVRGEEPAYGGTGTALTGRTAFLFPGQGGQRAGMGRQLYETFPAFARALDAAGEALAPVLDRPLRELLFAEPGSPEAVLLDRTTYTQPALFALDVALFALVETLGLRPDYLFGHSVGEITAAHVAGVLSLEHAGRLVAARGRLMDELAEAGEMLAIEASEEEVAETLVGFDGRVSIGSVNGPRALVVSGDADPIAALAELWRGRGRKARELRIGCASHSPCMDPMLDAFRAVAEGLTYGAPRIPVVSNLSGVAATEAELGSPDYWVRNVRDSVRFLDGVRWLEGQGAVRFLDLGPEGALAAMAQGCVAGDGPFAFAAALRPDRPEPETLLGALGELHAAGAPVDWRAAVAGGRKVDLPTYAFQRRRYWVEPAPGGGDVAAAGQRSPGHGLVAASIPLAGEDGWVLTGRLSPSTHRWLGEHTVGGTVLVPGTVWLELALAAGAEAGCPVVDELTLEAPLILGEGAVRFQLTVDGPGEDGRRPVEIHARPDDDELELPWTRHATGVLSPDSSPDGAWAPADWPPEGASALDVAELQDRMADLGIEHGAAFGCLRGAWADGDTVYAEVAFDEDASGTDGFRIHPVLLDAALQPAFAAGAEGKMPFAWTGVRAGGDGSRALRVRIETGDGDSLTLAAVDGSGAPVLAVESLAMRPLDAGGIAALGAASDPMLGLDWVELPKGEGGAAAGEAAIVELDAAAASDPDAVHARVTEALERVKEWLAGGAEGRLALVTVGAIAAREGESPELGGAAAWGLVRSAQTEHPDRIVLVDLDSSDASRAALPAALASGEPQVALRGGEALVPRLVRLSPEGAEPSELDADGTVLVTGATQGLGVLVARHLVERHGVRRLVLASRRGAEADGADDLVAELAAHGAEVRVEACDVSDREGLAALLDTIDADHPLTAAFHCAGVVADGTLEALDAEQVGRALAPKAGGAWNLHELTGDSVELVLFSSIAGTLGPPGQAAYAAANAFLDALAVRRHAVGLPGRSLAWGPWEQPDGMLGALDEVSRSRLLRFGAPLSAERGLQLLDAARAVKRPVIAPLPLDRTALRAAAGEGALPPLMSALVPASAQRDLGPAGSLADRLAGVEPADHPGVVLDLVRGQVAAVLGHSSADAVDPARAFKDLGFDSLAAVELRNRLGRTTGLRLPATLVFDHPNPGAAAEHLLSLVARESAPEARLGRELERVEALLADLPADGEARELLEPRLRSFNARLLGFLAPGSEATAAEGEDLAAASDDELFELIDKELGQS
jgi:acyl transferase domain-containing protein/acyl carrier protein